MAHTSLDASSLLRRHVYVGHCAHCERDHHLILTEQIGQGGYGAVFRARDLYDPCGRSYAVKAVPRPRHLSGRAFLHAVEREALLHADVSDCENVLTLHDVVEDLPPDADEDDEPEMYFVVLDYAAGGDLFGLSIERPALYGDIELVRSLFLQILDAVQTCHARGVYHRDLKTENVLLSKDRRQAYLADFGLATRREFSATFGSGSIYYMSPESMASSDDQLTYSTPHADVWSLGLLLFCMLTRATPWQQAASTDEHYRTYLADREGFFRSHWPISEEAEDILLGALMPEPQARFTLEEMEARVRAVKTFWMTEEEIAAAKDEHVREKASELALGARCFGGASLAADVADPDAGVHSFFEDDDEDEDDEDDDEDDKGEVYDPFRGPVDYIVATPPTSSPLLATKVLSGATTALTSPSPLSDPASGAAKKVHSLVPADRSVSDGPALGTKGKKASSGASAAANASAAAASFALDFYTSPPAAAMSTCSSRSTSSSSVQSRYSVDDEPSAVRQRLLHALAGDAAAAAVKAHALLLSSADHERSSSGESALGDSDDDDEVTAPTPPGAWEMVEQDGPAYAFATPESGDHDQPQHQQRPLAGVKHQQRLGVAEAWWLGSQARAV